MTCGLFVGKNNYSFGETIMFKIFRIHYFIQFIISNKNKGFR